MGGAKQLTRRLMGRRFLDVVPMAGALVLSALHLNGAENSPFLAPGSTGRGAAASNATAELDALQFSGVSIIGREQLFNFVDGRTRASFWVALNQSRNGFTVESYDPAEVAVVVRHGANTRRIALRKPTVAAAPAPAASPVLQPAPAAAAASQPQGKGVDEIKNPKTPEEIKQAEFEARMLVSDLLEISMRERERQRQLREQQARGQNAAASTAPRLVPANNASPSAPPAPASPRPAGQ